MADDERTATCPEQLARLVADPAAAPGVRGAAAAALRPLVERCARRVAAGSGQIGQDLRDEAFSWALAPDRLGNFAPRGPDSLERWLSKVLRNRLRDLCRARRDDTVLSTDLEGTPKAKSCTRTAAEMFYLQPFTDADLFTLRTWKVGDRVQLLCLAGLWLKVPQGLWRAWVEEYPLAWPFPQPSVLKADSPQERTGPLAAALGKRRNTLSQFWHRRQDLLRSLSSIRELGP